MSEDPAVLRMLLDEACRDRDGLQTHALVLRAEVERLQAIERRAIDALRGNSSETDEYEHGWLDACAEILGVRRP